MRSAFPIAAFALVSIAIAPAAQSATPRDLLTQAAFQTTDKKAALTLINAAIAGADHMIAVNPRDREGQFQHAMGIGYRARLTKKPADAKTARKLFESLVASNPRDPEFQIAIGGWHLDAIAAGFLAAAFLGAKKGEGLDGIDKAVQFGGDRAFFRSFAAMMRIRLDTDDVAAARALAERAAVSPTPTALDMIGKRDAQAMLVPLRAGDGKAAAVLAHKLLPFGHID